MGASTTLTTPITKPTPPMLPLYARPKLPAFIHKKREKSADNYESWDWASIIGGKYNSARCIDDTHRVCTDPQYLRRSRYNSGQYIGYHAELADDLPTLPPNWGNSNIPKSHHSLSLTARGRLEHNHKHDNNNNNTTNNDTFLTATTKRSMLTSSSDSWFPPNNDHNSNNTNINHLPVSHFSSHRKSPVAPKTNTVNFVDDPVTVLGDSDAASASSSDDRPSSTDVRPNTAPTPCRGGNSRESGSPSNNNNNNSAIGSARFRSQSMKSVITARTNHSGITSKSESSSTRNHRNNNDEMLLSSHDLLKRMMAQEAMKAKSTTLFPPLLTPLGRDPPSKRPLDNNNHSSGSPLKSHRSHNANATTPSTKTMNKRPPWAGEIETYTRGDTTMTAVPATSAEPEIPVHPNPRYGRSFKPTGNPATPYRYLTNYRLAVDYANEVQELKGALKRSQPQENLQMALKAYRHMRRHLTSNTTTTTATNYVASDS